MTNGEMTDWEENVLGYLEGIASTLGRIADRLVELESDLKKAVRRLDQIEANTEP